MLDLYTNIKNRRKELNMTQSELAEKAGYSNKSSIATIEAGKVDLPLSKINDLAKALDCTSAELMGWSLDNDFTEIDKDIIHTKLREAASQIHGFPVDNMKLYRAMHEKNISVEELAKNTSLPLARIETIINTKGALLTKDELTSLRNVLGDVLDKYENARISDKNYRKAISALQSSFPRLFDMSRDEVEIYLAYKSSDELTKAMVRRTLGLD